MIAALGRPVQGELGTSFRYGEFRCKAKPSLARSMEEARWFASGPRRIWKEQTVLFHIIEMYDGLITAAATLLAGTTITAAIGSIVQGRGEENRPACAIIGAGAAAIEGYSHFVAGGTKLK